MRPFISYSPEDVQLLRPLPPKEESRKEESRWLAEVARGVLLVAASSIAGAALAAASARLLDLPVLFAAVLAGGAAAGAAAAFAVPHMAPDAPKRASPAMPPAELERSTLGRWPTDTHDVLPDGDLGPSRTPADHIHAEGSRHRPPTPPAQIRNATDRHPVLTLLAGAAIARAFFGGFARPIIHYRLDDRQLPRRLPPKDESVDTSLSGKLDVLPDGRLGLSRSPADRIHAEGAGHRRPSPLAQIWSATDRHPVLTLLAGAAVTTVLFVVNLTRAPDFNIDEVFYVLAGQNVVKHDLLAWGATPIFVHPPVFFLAVGAWLKLTGHESSSILEGIHAARYLGAGFDVLAVVLIGLAARVWSPQRPAAIRGRVVVTAMALAAINPFLLRFGRTVLIEPMGLCLGLATLLLAWRVRSSPTRWYVGIVGLAIGVTILTKMPALFLVCGPMVASLLGRDWRGMRRNVGALLVGAFVWLSFPAWAVVSGSGRAFFDVQDVSVQRLLGTLQVSGLHRAGVSATASFVDTLWQYLPGYVPFLLGAIGLGGGVLRIWRHGPDAIDEGGRFILGIGVPSYAFLAYSLLVGQANEQLTVYTIPASMLLAADLPRFVARSSAPRLRARFTNTAGAMLCLAAIGLGTASWLTYFWPARDNATAIAGRFITTTYPCRLVNATGDIYHWAAVLPANRLAAFPSGSDALVAGVHIFLLSPKDAEFRYGSMSPELEAWIRANGREVFSHPSHTYREISVWVVGTPPDLTGVAPDACGNPLPAPTGHAQATTFLAVLGIAFATVGAVTGAATVVKRRRDG